ncbi:hypothetical protein [Roseobacter sp. HKCCA0434]|uniref:hypothetical protein n=1 Tax=Roseobacter sp. HKCCA0434 TaxID=3079297 RepID=UPI002905CA3D|nr:hypothetical protein [Roseobacter sp. HKCCA0434]
MLSKPIAYLTATMTCAIVVASCAYFYDITANPGHEEASHQMLAIIGAVVGAIWAAVVFPIMGRSVSKDVFIILIAFPAVGAIIGQVFTVFGMIMGIYLAVTMPFVWPWPIALIYIASAVIAFLLPRIGQPKNTRSAAAQ